MGTSVQSALVAELRTDGHRLLQPLDEIALNRTSSPFVDEMKPSRQSRRVKHVNYAEPSVRGKLTQGV